jgi:outer membrane protein
MRSAPVLTLALILALQFPATAAAQADGQWLVRGRGIVIAPDASSKPAGLDVKADATIEIDITRHLTPLLSLELVLATASQEVTAGGTSLGSVNHLPPTLLLQVHPIREGPVQPYLGAGGNLTIFYARSGGLEALNLSTSLGWAVQGGVDIPVGRRSIINLDLKYVNIQTEVESGGSKLYELEINPWVIGAGLGYRF